VLIINEVVSNLKYRFDPKAAYRVTPRKTDRTIMTEGEEDIQPAYPPVTLENFQSNVFEPNSKSSKASRNGSLIKGALENQESRVSRWKVEDNKVYDPASLDETQVRIGNISVK